MYASVGHCPASTMVILITVDLHIFNVKVILLTLLGELRTWNMRNKNLYNYMFP
ncbi:hypothetical protein RhiirC2_802081 [Rhizophagus irregularis]|uniref:Uncharacterized protein n=1 Tax=Rhizophagus irregularis TaxID=588596 RepID=A0A2N1M1P3_9GLOM|nr:hypothetical protein RhiirC2_802081 [Rhizophagus irregularis]